MGAKLSQISSAEIRYKTYGNSENPAVLLLHGYLEALEIWDNFAPILAKNYFVITMDIPGHGKSGIYSSVHRMDDLAEAAFQLVNELGIKRIHVVGHSMGGYVALAFRENYHDFTISCILFHSTCYPDTDEKKENRDREIRLLREGRKELIVNTNIPRAFADDNLEKLKDEVERAKEIAIASNDEGVIALLRGMKERPDRCMLLRDDKVPLLVIAGRKDNYIPFDVADGIKHLGKNVEISVLENSGHMGFIEEKNRSFEILDHFFIQHAD
jgi:pimeloyl-ACP methyl ester carboxylesterase